MNNRQKNQILEMLKQSVSSYGGAFDKSKIEAGRRQKMEMFADTGIPRHMATEIYALVKKNKINRQDLANFINIQRALYTSYTRKEIKKKDFVESTRGNFNTNIEAKKLVRALPGQLVNNAMRSAFDQVTYGVNDEYDRIANQVKRLVAENRKIKNPNAKPRKPKKPSSTQSLFSKNKPLSNPERFEQYDENFYEPPYVPIEEIAFEGELGLSKGSGLMGGATKAQIKAFKNRYMREYLARGELNPDVGALNQLWQQQLNTNPINYLSFPEYKNYVLGQQIKDIINRS